MTESTEVVKYITPAELLEKSNILYEFVDLFSSYERTPRNYDWSEDLSMNEVHLLARINENPGILSSELAESMHRTKGLVSQLLSRLEKGGYIVHMTDKNDSKKKPLFVTQQGKKLCEAHENYDARILMKTYNYLLRDCSPEEIEHFYKVMQVYNNIMNAAERKRKKLMSQNSKPMD